MSEVDRLRGIMQRLRGPDGCPWDHEQTMESLRTYLVEETYEVLDAIVSGSTEAHREELGDLLLQIVFQSQIAEEHGEFDLESVARGIADKIVRRHPHVFGEERLDTAEQVLTQWEQIKAQERVKRRGLSMFGSVPGTLPALLKALRLSSKACRVGFDWPDRRQLLGKVHEELSELHRALEHGDRTAIEEEIGDLLFTIANVARVEGIDPEEALQQTNRKFIKRFGHVEQRLREEGLQPAPEHRPRMETLWEEAKDLLRRTEPARNFPSGGTSDNAPRPDPREEPS